MNLQDILNGEINLDDVDPTQIIRLIMNAETTEDEN